MHGEPDEQVVVDEWVVTLVVPSATSDADVATARATVARRLATVVRAGVVPVPRAVVSMMPP